MSDIASPLDGAPLVNLGPAQERCCPRCGYVEGPGAHVCPPCDLYPAQERAVRERIRRVIERCAAIACNHTDEYHAIKALLDEPEPWRENV